MIKYIKKRMDDPIKVVGIMGLGRVRKITLAKEMYNWWHSKYDRSNFLSDVRDTVVKNSLKDIQKKHLKDLKQVDVVEFDSVSEGIVVLRK
eukprot:Gb_10465 [translate_table: standard]